MRPLPAPRSLLAALLLLTTLSAPVRAAAVCNVTYSGGPVTSDVQVVQVDWGTGIDASIDSALGGFFSTILDSAYIDWLVEYDTSGLTGGSQTISRGTFGGRYVITPSTSSTTVSDATVGAEIAAQIAAGHLPAPTLDGAGHANTLYMIEFPSTVTISGPGGAGNSCSAFCAYHSSVPIGGIQIPYAVMPDASNGACAGGCGTGTALENATMVHSHQIVEVITDPDIAVPSGIAWYSTDAGCGEIGDICSSQTAVVANYTVQKEWSRVQNACIATASAAIPICTGTNGPTCRRCVTADEGRAGGCTGGTPRCDTVASSATYGLCVAAAASTSSGGKGGGCASAGIADTGPLGLLLAAVALRRRARAAPGPRASA